MHQTRGGRDVRNFLDGWNEPREPEARQRRHDHVEGRIAVVVVAHADQEGDGFPVSQE
jgi:hypothetical protein